MINISTPFKFITLFFSFAFLFVIRQAFSDSYGAPGGYTGAPGDNGNCTTCHTGTAVSNSSDIMVYTNMTNGQYIPDSIYFFTIRAKKSGCVKFGFETTILNSNASPTKLGILQTPTSSRTQRYTGTREYMTHTSSGTSAIYTDSTDWTFNWKAPSSVSGDAKLYVAMNATNNNSNYTGDEIHLKSFTFPQTTNIPAASVTTNVNSICQNDSIYFQGSGTNGTSSYQWTFSGGTPAASTSQNIWVKFTAGTKVCSLRVANSIMYSAYTTKTVTVNAIPSANISYNTNVLCEGDSILLSVTNTTGYTYQWQKDTVNINGATASQVYVKFSGSYRVIIINTSGGCVYTTAPVSLTFNPKPQAFLAAPNGNSVCQGDSILLKANNGTNYSYYWYKNNVLQVQSPDSNYYAKQTGSYYVKTYLTSGCNTQSNAIALTFFNKPSGNITSSADSVCQGDSILLTAVNGDTITTYQWKRNGIDVTGANSKTYYATSSGGYTAELISNRGCKSTFAVKQIKVNPYPAANFIDSTKNSCTYSLKIRNTGNFSFQWQRNGTAFNTTDTIVTASQTGTYTLKITNSSGCSITTNSIFLNIPNAPNANMTPISNAVICSDSSGVTYLVPPASGTTFNWYKNGSLINGATQNSLTVSDSGNYYVLVDNGLCVVPSSTRSVKVNAAPSINFIDSTKVGCAYSLKIRTAGNFNFQWIRNGVPFNTTDTMIMVTQSGTYILLMTSASGCTKTTNSIILNMPAYYPDATITPSTNAILCSDSIGVTYQVPAAGGTTFKWYKNGTVINGASQNSLNITDSGNYYVTVDNGFCSVTSATRNVKVNPTPVAQISTNDSTFCTGDSSVLITNNISGASYQWSKDNLPLSNTNSAAYSAITTGFYNVKVILGSCSKISNSIYVREKLLPIAPVISRNGNILTSTTASSYQWYKDGLPVSGATQQSFTVTVIGTYTVEITGSNGCKNSSSGLYVNPTGINGCILMNIVSAYPNPVQSNLFLNFADFGLHEIEVIDASGRVLKSLKETGTKALIDFKDTEAGIYFIKVFSEVTTQIIRVVKK